jgi:hypothetical protein
VFTVTVLWVAVLGTLTEEVETESEGIGSHPEKIYNRESAKNSIFFLITTIIY